MFSTRNLFRNNTLRYISSYLNFDPIDPLFLQNIYKNNIIFYVAENAPKLLIQRNETIKNLKKTNNRQHLTIISSDIEIFNEYFEKHVTRYKNFGDIDRMVNTVDDAIKIVNKYNKFLKNEYVYLKDPANLKSQILRQIDLENKLYDNGFIYHMKILKRIGKFDKEICDDYLDTMIRIHGKDDLINELNDKNNKNNTEFLKIINDMISIGVDFKSILSK